MTVSLVKMDFFNSYDTIEHWTTTLGPNRGPRAGVLLLSGVAPPLLIHPSTTEHSLFRVGFFFFPRPLDLKLHEFFMLISDLICFSTLNYDDSDGLMSSENDLFCCSVLW
jgi:hypothetical protein